MKDRVGRVRYVAFRVPGAPRSRGDVSGSLQPPRKLTRFDGAHGIAKTTHLDQAGLVARLREVGLETLAASGTILAAARALPPGCEAARRTSPPPPKSKLPPGTKAGDRQSSTVRGNFK